MISTSRVNKSLSLTLIINVAFYRQNKKKKTLCLFFTSIINRMSALIQSYFVCSINNSNEFSTPKVLLWICFLVARKNWQQKRMSLQFFYVWSWTSPQININFFLAIFLLKVRKIKHFLREFSTKCVFFFTLQNQRITIGWDIKACWVLIRNNLMFNWN